MQEYQVQQKALEIDPETGELQERKVMYKNRVADVHTGRQATGSLILPGSDENENLDMTISNIKKYLTNLNEIAQTFRSVSDEVTRDTVDVASSRAVKTVQDHLDTYSTAMDERATNIEEELRNHRYEIDDPIDYGKASGQYFGHVRLSDNFRKPVNPEPFIGAADGIGASSLALQNAWFDLMDGGENARAPQNHAIETGIYGKSTKDKYGHVRIGDLQVQEGTHYYEPLVDGTISNPLEKGYGISASHEAIRVALNALHGRIDNHEGEIKNHATSSLDNGYGGGTATMYGHVKLNDEYVVASPEAAAASGTDASRSVAASGYALRCAYFDLQSQINTHTTVDGTQTSAKANGSKYGHVKIVDFDDVANSQNADSGIVASGAAVYELKKSVADGKKMLADALSVYNVSVASNAAFSALKTGIDSACANWYNKGHGQGVIDADARENTSSYNWGCGWNAGVAAADARPAPGTVNYQSGYDAGVAAADGRINYSSASYTDALDRVAYGAYSNQQVIGCWVAVYWENPGEGKQLPANSIMIHPALQKPPTVIHSVPEGYMYSAGELWAVQIYFKEFLYDSRTKCRFCTVFLGHGDINAIIRNATTNLAALRVF